MRFQSLMACDLTLPKCLTNCPIDISCLFSVAFTNTQVLFH